jgi:prepilin-type processing-associated H-X9-DG protein
MTWRAISARPYDPASPGGSVGPGAGLGGLAGLDSAGANFVMLDGSAEYNSDKASGY